MSVDSLRPDRIATDRAAQPRLRSGARGAGRAERAGLDPIKLNVVVMRGINDDEVDGLRAADARASVARALHRAHAGRRDARAHVGARRAERRGSRADRARSRRSTPASRTGARQRAGGVLPCSPARAGTIGVITPMTHTYCGVVQSRAPHRRRSSSHLPVRRSRGAICATPLRAGEPLEPFFRRRARRQAEGARAARRCASADCARSRRSAADRSTSAVRPPSRD